MKRPARSKAKAKAPKVSVVCVGGFGSHALAQLAKLLAPKSYTVSAEAFETIAVAADRFTKVSATGVLLPKSAKEWEGVYEAATGLVWGRRLLPGTADWKDSIAKANAASLCGKPARAPTVRERFCLSDFTRLDPALDTDYFDASETNAWEWTSTEAAPSGFAWVVGLGDGSSFRYNQSYRSRVRAVRAGQYSELGSSAARSV